MRIGPNELVFSEVFLLEHKQIIGRISSVTGIPVDKINNLVRKKIESENRSKKAKIGVLNNGNNGDLGEEQKVNMPRYVTSGTV